MRVGIFIQARTNSTRLPGKIFEKIGDREILQHVVDACKAVNVLGKVNEYVVAVLCPVGDQRVIDWCKEKGVECFEGDETDLIKRYLQAAEHFVVEAVVRITADCWSMPTPMIEECIKVLANVDYASNCIIRSYPEGWDAQAASVKALMWVDQNQRDEREHVFKALDENDLVRKEFIKAGYTFSSIVNPNNIIFQHNSIDTKEDLERARRLYEA